MPEVFERFIKFAEKQCESFIAYNPQQNGRAERINRVLLDKARCLIVDLNLQNKFWGEAVNTAVYLNNRSPKRCLDGKMLEEIWTGVKPNLSHLRIFGSKACAHAEKHERGKVDQKAKPCTMVEYCESQKGYRLWDQQQQLVFASQDVVFMEEKPKPNTTVYLPVEELPLHSNTTPEHNQDKKSEEKKQEDSPKTTIENKEEDDQSSDDDLPTITTISLRPKKKPKHLDDYVLYSAISDHNEPKSYKETTTGPESKQWIKAIKDEYASIQKNHTWEPTDLPAECNVVGSKWIFKKKVSSDGSTKYKARLVARGFSQIHGVDYQDTYSLVVRYTSLQLLFAYDAKLDLEIFHYDVDTAFLHDTLEETVYLQQPSEGFVNQTNESKVCHLKKVIYGLKQDSRVWNQKLDSVFKKLNLKKSNYDACIYYYYNNENLIIVAVLWMTYWYSQTVLNSPI